MNDLVVCLALNFYICSILGFIYEILLMYFFSDVMVNPGFLTGPYLPIYGTGSVLLSFLVIYKNNPLKIFLLSFLISGSLELICGKILINFFHMRLWDYSGNLLNIDGLVCFLSAFVFGVGGIIVNYFVWPLIKKIYKILGKETITKIISSFSLIFYGDLFATTFK